MKNRTPFSSQSPRLQLLPIFFEQERSDIFWDWVLPEEDNAPKPRNLLRKKEKPPENLSLENLSRVLPFVEVLPSVQVSATGEGLRKIFHLESDAFLVSGGREEFIRFLQQYGKPILPLWDNWGYVWNARYLPARDAYTFTPFGAEEVKQGLRALSAYKFLNTLKVLYFGDCPSHTIPTSTCDFGAIHRQYGVSFVRKELQEFITAVQRVPNAETAQIVNEWEQYILGNRENYLTPHAKIYVALKRFLEEEQATGLTIDCAALPNADFVPCFSVSNLINAGYVWACEGDIPALLAMATLIGISGQPALMGNIFENNTHQDIEEDIIVINHDVVPPSMGTSECTLQLNDFHGTGKGLTGYIDLRQGEEVTLVGIAPTASELWTMRGEISWTKDTTHCRMAVGVKVANAKQIARELGAHHQAMAYGNWIKEIKLLGEILGIETHVL